MTIRRAIVASYGVPEPDRDTGSRRVFELARMLQDAGWSVSFVALNGILRRTYLVDLQQRGIAVHGRRPSDPLGSSAAFEEALDAGPCDLCVLAFWPVAERLMPIVRRLSPSTRVLVASIDLHFLRDARRVLQPRHAATPGGLLGAHDALQLTGELNTYAAADGVLTVSEKEARFINDLTGQPGLAHAVDLVEDQEWLRRPFARRSGILTVGNYTHLPNVQAVEHLCDDILPHLDAGVRAAHPVYVVGAGLDEPMRRFAHASSQIELVGWVPQMRPYLEQSRIAVVPLRYGAGAKGKVIEALMAGTPVVTTSIGAEGLGFRDREHLRIADDPRAFAKAMTELLTDARRWKAMAHAGRQRAAALHGRATITARFLDVVGHLLDAAPKPALLPEAAPDQYRSRLHYQDVPRIITRLRGALAASVPADAVCAVVTGGEDWLLDLGTQPVVRVPDPDERAKAENRPRSAIAIEDVEQLRANGARFLVVPSRASWWLDRLPELKAHLTRDGEAAIQYGCCVVYRLRTVETPDHVAAEAPVAAPPPAPARRSTANVRLIAFYLPQFHPIPENDAWWGPGFTEWTSVARARPLFPGHAQPAIPADLGFYDLRMAETRAAQAEMARAAGIHGFCYYHYWFHGKRLLERPFEDVLASGQPDFPFCLCWANEPWSRRWDGSENDVLQDQHHSDDDDRAHMTWLLPALKDPRAIRVDDKPLFLVYRARKLPDPARTAELWKRMAREAGLAGLHLVAVETAWDARWDATQAGFDASVLFQPQFTTLRTVPRLEIPAHPDLQVYDYSSAWPTLATAEPVPYLRYESVFPTWDNTPRAGERGTVVHGSTPAAYEDWLTLAIDRATDRPRDHQLVFINAWNEWAEGCHLEPDVQNGTAYLEATRRALGPQTPDDDAAADANSLAALTPVPWDFPQDDAGTLAPDDLAVVLRSFEDRLRRWSEAHREPAADGPAVAVEVPVSKGSWIMPCIESVLNQSSPAWHLYLHSGAADDLSRRVLNTIAALEHPRITVLFDKSNGRAHARRILSARSTESCILPMDDDEMLHPRAVEAILAAAADKPWFSLMRIGRVRVDPDGSFGPNEAAPLALPSYQRGVIRDLDSCRRPYVISRRSYSRTSGWQRVGGSEIAEECDLFLQLDEQGSIERLDLPLSYARGAGGPVARARSDVWRRLADSTIKRTGFPLTRINDAPPFDYARRPAPRPDVSMMDVVIAFYESDEQELCYANSRVLASKEFAFVKLSDVLTFSQSIKADLFPCIRIELTCVLLSPFQSTLSIRVTDPETRELVADGTACLDYDDGPGLVTVKVEMHQRSTPVSARLDCTITCTPDAGADASFNLVLQENGEGERVAAMRLFRHSPGFSRRMLARCVDSIKACGVSDDAIHIVNKKQSAAANRNEGFARTTRPYVCYADDDVEIVDPDTFTRLLRTMAETDAAVIGPRLVTDARSIFCADPYFDEHLHPKPRGLGASLDSDCQYTYTREVPWLPSTLIVCRREAVRIVGGFDEGYVGSQMEDVDFCLKIRQRDLRCVYDGGVDVVHYNYQRNDRFTENLKRFSGRWIRYPELFASDPLPLESAESDYAVMAAEDGRPGSPQRRAGTQERT